jgi:hypothetical protein
MTWHSYRLATDIGVLLIALGMVVFCWSGQRRRAYIPGFAFIAGAAAGEVIRETIWPARGTTADLSFTLIDSGLLIVGLFIVVYRWRRVGARPL